MTATEQFLLTPPKPKAAPLVAITFPTSHTVNQSNITFSVSLKDQGSGVGKLVWKVNDREVGETRGLRVRENRALQASKVLSLAPGKNKVEVIAYSQDNTTASPPEEFNIFYKAPDVLQGWYTRQYAVVVGIDQYQSDEMAPLSNAVNDAEAVSKMFKKMGFNVHELYNRRATKKNIRGAIARIRKNIRKSDSFCFYFAGHGEGLSLENHKREGYILPYDADIDPGDSDIMQYDDAAISLSRLKTYLEDTRAKHISLLLDSCFSGLAMKRARLRLFPDDMNRSYYQKLLSRRAINILTAGDDHPVEDGTDHSPFTQAILNGLERGNLDLYDQDGFATFNQLAVYVKNKVGKATGGRQEPQFDNLSMDDGDFIFKLPPPSP